MEMGALELMGVEGSIRGRGVDTPQEGPKMGVFYCENLRRKCCFEGHS